MCNGKMEFSDPDIQLLGLFLEVSVYIITYLPADCLFN